LCHTSLYVANNTLPVMQSITAARAGLTLRLAQCPSEVLACQKLRYQVFYEEMGARANAATRAIGLDADRFDAVCDHLVVVQHIANPTPHAIPIEDGQLVGTYRLLRQEVAEKSGGFYTQDEFDIAPVIAAHPQLKFLELGRSCVLAPYRTRPVVELLWQGIWNYVRHYGLDVMLGCASFEGTNPEVHAAALAFLARNFSAPAEWRVSANPKRYASMTQVSLDAISEKAVLKALPSLIKGYLRLGCYIGDGAVIDEQFNTVDVLIVLPVSRINARYFSHFGQPND
jgi:L-ornithine Nalpha-acyltransferase